MSPLRHPGLWLSLALPALIGLWPIATQNAADREVVFTILMAMVLASSLNIFLGYTGYVNFGSIVFFGLGGYVGFYLMSAQGMPLYPAILGGGAASALLAFTLGKAILRLRGAYFALATIGVNEAARAFVNNFKPFGGPIGMSLNFRVYSEYGGAASALWLTYSLLLLLTLGVVLVSFLVKTSRFGALTSHERGR
jgi:branched-chain amino acid transport system permease protein